MQLKSFASIPGHGRCMKSTDKIKDGQLTQKEGSAKVSVGVQQGLLFDPTVLTELLSNARQIGL